MEEPERSEIDESATVRQVADHYSRRENQSREQRERSPIIQLKKLNNWVKSALIRKYTHRGDRVLDLACGKGGDLSKWDKANISFYFGVDVAEGSIEDARARYNGEADMSMQKSMMRFPARLACADCFSVPLDSLIAEFGPFGICSCQFAFHYSFQSEDRVRCALRNISSLLEPEGVFFGTMPDANVIVQKLRASKGLEFGNSVYNIEFNQDSISKRFPKAKPFGVEYNFRLVDAVDCPEWLVPFPVLESLAETYGLELDFKLNFHEFVQQYSSQEPFLDLMHKIVGEGWHDSISEDEWDAAYIYMAFAFKKKGRRREHDGGRKRPRHEPPHIITRDDVLHFLPH